MLAILAAGAVLATRTVLSTCAILAASSALSCEKTGGRRVGAASYATESLAGTKAEVLPDTVSSAEGRAANVCYGSEGLVDGRKETANGSVRSVTCVAHSTLS